MPKRRRDQEDIEIDAGEAPTTINPYDVLALSQDASQDDVKRAYRKAALRYHPDKAMTEDKESAHVKFQEIAFAYAILSDERRRKRFDATGRTEESLDLDDDDFDWTMFFREQFAGVVNEETIDKFSQEYRGSDEERQHILEAYEKVEGNMSRLYDLVMLSDMADDEDRFRATIDKAIADGEIESFAKYTNEKESTRKKRLDRARKQKAAESKESVKAAEELHKQKHGKKEDKKATDDDDLGSLAALIQKRQQGRAETFFDSLEAKYAPKGRKGSHKASPTEEPPEEAFAANRKTKASGEGAEAARKIKRTKR